MYSLMLCPKSLDDSILLTQQQSQLIEHNMWLEMMSLVLR